jgi:hypothetical protein
MDELNAFFWLYFWNLLGGRSLESSPLRLAPEKEPPDDDDGSYETSFWNHLSKNYFTSCI